MDSNYEWQRHQTRNRVNSRRHEGELARQAKAANGSPASRGLLARLFARLTGRPRPGQPKPEQQPAVVD